MFQMIFGFTVSQIVRIAALYSGTWLGDQRPLAPRTFASAVGGTLRLVHDRRVFALTEW